MKITIFSELSEGGIADYAHDQANALAARGLDIEMLCSSDFPQGRVAHYETRTILTNPWAEGVGGWAAKRKAALAFAILKNAKTLRLHITNNKPDAVITHFSETLAPLWSGKLRALRQMGTTLHSVLHDPARDYKIGPTWWHKLSVKEAFSLYDSVFVHTRDQVAVPEPVKVVWVPYGVHSYPAPVRSRKEVRQDYAIPDVAPLIVAFGYIRDNKNLDLILRALADFPEMYLLVAGKDQAGGNKPIEFYQQLAESLGCQDRCRWLNRYLTPQDTADILCASDLAALTYSRSFVSSSAFFSVAANYRLPCLMSSGSKTAAAAIERYGLGIWIDPDSVKAIKGGLEKWLRGGISPNWDAYKRDNSWARNAEIVHQTILAARPRNADMV